MSYTSTTLCAQMVYSCLLWRDFSHSRFKEKQLLLPQGIVYVTRVKKKLESEFYLHNGLLFKIHALLGLTCIQ